MFGFVVNGIQNAIDSKEKVFSTGSRGFWVGGKIQIGDKRYQMSGNLVEIGSKPTATKKSAKATL
jgi:hypothetical protein